MPNTKQKKFKDWDSVKWLREKITIKRLAIVLSVIGNIVMLIIIVAMI